MSKSVLITGGGRGIGAATARLAAGAGYDVVVNYAGNEASAEAVVSDVKAQGQRAFAFKADVSSEDQVLAMFAAIDDQFGRLDALVNNAGMIDQVARLEQMSAARIMRILQVNVLGSFLCAREAVKRMSRDKGGKGGAIVNMSSAAARLGGASNFIDYAASKGAIDTFTKGLALEVAGQGIRVNAVRPGLIDTELHGDTGAPDRVAELCHLVPMARGGSPEEVADCIMWLISDKASYVTDAYIDVGGGR